MSVDEVVAEVERYDCPLVEITGGEPLLQEDVYPLMERLLARGRTVHARNRRPSADRPRAGRGREDRRREVPRQRRADKNDWDNLDRLAPHDEVKFVVKDRADYEFARDVIARTTCRRAAPPCCCRRSTACSIRRTLSEWMLADRLPARLQLQLHKYIWSPTREGSETGGRFANDQLPITE